MRTLYLDCGMGAAGDMLTAALLELLPDPESFVKELNALGIPGVEYVREDAVKCGIGGTHMSVRIHGEEESEEMLHHHHEHEHHHEYDHEHTHDYGHGEHHHHQYSGLHDIEHIVRGHLHLPQQVQDDILTVYGLIAEAESRAHGMPVEEIHFHEVGTMDAIADVTAVCLLMNRLAPDEVVVSPIHVGSGQVRCAHGILPVPAPATAFILRDVPIYGGTVQGELCTPTGAALLRHFATRFGAMPPMRAQAIGYGKGKKDFEAANCVRAMLGESGSAGDTVTELSCNVDDMTGEAVGFALEELLAAGALEAFTVPVGMKKSRPGVMLCVLCREQDSERIAGLMLRHTTSIGVRAHSCRRYVLTRRIETVQTPYGEVRRKLSEGYGASRVKYEYDDLAHIARETGRTLDEVRSELTH